LTRNAVTGRTALNEVRECFRSDLVFTPIRNERLDLERLEAYLDSWLRDLEPADIFGGGALLTGLTAEQRNAQELVALIRRKVKGALVASALDPGLESWLAFHGSCGSLSREHPEQSFLNLDIGGGTTNLALGRRGEVLATTHVVVGARHFQVMAGSYRLTRLSSQARALMERLALAREVGQDLTAGEVGRILDDYVSAIETAAGQLAGPSHAETTPVLTFSGGVGELVYGYVETTSWPATTAFGDLGIDLARRLLASPLARDVQAWRPAARGRATVYGLLRHNTEISGSTLYVPSPEMLPLSDLPILGSVTGATPQRRLEELLELARRSSRGACLRITLGGSDAERVRELGTRLSQAVAEAGFPGELPLVLIVRENVGKALGNYVTAWGERPLRLLVIDEITPRDAQFIQIGALRQQVLPVSFYGTGP
jgi:ethanolamine utilization protein EutA